MMMKHRPLFSLFLSLLLAASVIPRLESAGDGGAGVLPLELWCVAKNNADDDALQAALDWACGTGGASCGPIQPGGSCFDGMDLLDRASYAFNDYYLRHNLTEDSCDFSGNAALTSLNPSHDGCKLPSSFTVSNGNSGVPSAMLGTGQGGGYTSGGNRITEKVD